MVSTSEKSFGARLLNAQNILTYIKALPDYDPPQATETVTGFQNLQIDIVESNIKESEYEQHYRAAVKNRQNAFRKGKLSLIKLLPDIRGAVIAAYGKKSHQSEIVSSAIKQMRDVTLIQPPPVPEGQAPPASISQSQQSYGSLTKAFYDLINTINQFGGYTSSNPNLQMANLQAFAQNLDNLNILVAQTYQKLSLERENRLALYGELSQRVQRIKFYVRAQYGAHSKIYSLVKGLPV